jgi:hypothetical protein
MRMGENSLDDAGKLHCRQMAENRVKEMEEKSDSDSEGIHARAGSSAFIRHPRQADPTGGWRLS